MPGHRCISRKLLFPKHDCNMHLLKEKTWLPPHPSPQYLVLPSLVCALSPSTLPVTTPTSAPSPCLCSASCLSGSISPPFLLLFSISFPTSSCLWTTLETCLGLTTGFRLPFHSKPTSSLVPEAGGCPVVKGQEASPAFTIFSASLQLTLQSAKSRVAFFEEL